MLCWSEGEKRKFGLSKDLMASNRELNKIENEVIVFFFVKIYSEPLCCSKPPVFVSYVGNPIRNLEKRFRFKQTLVSISCKGHRILYNFSYLVSRSVKKQIVITTCKEKADRYHAKKHNMEMRFTINY